MRKSNRSAGIRKRKEEREEIKKANDLELKSNIIDMKYILNIRSQMMSLNPVELEAYQVLKEATTKTKRYYAIKRFKEIVYN